MKENLFKRVFIFIFVFFICLINKCYCAQRIEGIENFPEDYKHYLKELNIKYPNWNFIALYTNLDWNYVINEENIFGKNLVPKNYNDRWKNTKSGEYNVEVDSGWVDSSKQAVKYCMDPRNFLNEIRIFQFELLSYSERNTLEGIEKILYGTEFYNNTVSFYDSNGILYNTSDRYSDLIFKASKISLVNSFHLASRIKQEVGPFLSHSSISGIVEGYRGLYNFYNIGATSSAEPMGAIKNGLRYALDGKGANQTIRDKFVIPWNNKERAITGGAIFIGSSYINIGQNNIYLQKFDVNNENKSDLFWHQYMTNVLAPYSESKSVYNGYLNSDIINNELNFLIPIYNNMDKIPENSPNINPNDYLPDNTKVYVNVSTKLNLRSGPGSSYEILKTLNNGEILIRIAKGNQSGELWDKVVLNNGMIGYVFQSYLERYIDAAELITDTEGFDLLIGKNKKINAYVLPVEANNKNIKFSTLNNEIATVDSVGNVKGISEGETEILVETEENNIQKFIKVNVINVLEGEVIFKNEWKIIEDEISGINYEKNSALDFKDNILTKYTVDILNKSGEILNENNLVGTGSKILIKENEKIIFQYNVILYGDVNGDGKINSIDLLVLQRHILEIQTLNGLFLKAGNIFKNNNLPTSVDLLLIQRHILGLKIIEQ